MAKVSSANRLTAIPTGRVKQASAVFLMLGVTLAVQADLKQRKFIGRFEYYCKAGAKVVEDLYQRQDTGFHQVVLGLPNGSTIALQQTESQVGIRFTDDIQYAWTLKGNHAVLEEWVGPNDWRVRFGECQYQLK